jgi:signal transduction histidine kinase
MTTVSLPLSFRESYQKLSGFSDIGLSQPYSINCLGCFPWAGNSELRCAKSSLVHLVETTAKTLKLPYVAVERADTSQRVAVGRTSIEPEQFPLIYHAQLIGTLLVAPRSPGESLNAADRFVLENAARQASHIVYTARLADDLQESRHRIVTAREEERRRLRRDLHDGLGPSLATLTLQAEAARDWLPIKPGKSEALLGEIVTGTQTALADIRRVVYVLRPPALDDLGLVSAIKEQAAH